MKFTTKEITHSAVFSALICILSLISVPVGAVPVTLSLFALMCVPIILGAKKGVLSVVLYILSGAIGLPVFSGFRGGIQVLFGPTGGYIISYVFIALIIGAFADKIRACSLKTAVKTALICFLGLLICYTLGTLQYIYITNTPPYTAVIQCVLVFLPFDIIKVICAVGAGLAIRKRVRHLH